MVRKKDSLKKLQRGLRRAIKQFEELHHTLETTRSTAMWLREALACVKLARETRRR